MRPCGEHTPRAERGSGNAACGRIAAADEIFATREVRHMGREVLHKRQIYQVMFSGGAAYVANVPKVPRNERPASSVMSSTQAEIHPGC